MSTIKSIDTSSIIPDPENARLHSTSQLQVIAKSLKRFNQQKPIIIDKDNVIIAGNGTFLAARDILGWDKIDVVYSDLDKDEARAYGIADNSIADQSIFDLEVLSKHIQTLSDLNPMQDWESIGFDEETVKPLVEEPNTILQDFLTGKNDKDAEPEDGKPKMGRPIKVTEEMRETIDQAINLIRLKESDMKLTEGRCVELIVADWLNDARDYVEG